MKAEIKYNYVKIGNKEIVSKDKKEVLDFINKNFRIGLEIKSFVYRKFFSNLEELEKFEKTRLKREILNEKILKKIY